MSEMELPSLALRLVSQEEKISIKQYPAFNERFRRRFSQPVYLKCLNPEGAMVGFLCLVRLRIGGIKCAAVIDGPCFFASEDSSSAAIASLFSWFDLNTFAFVRFSHRDQADLAPVLALDKTVQENPLPFIPRFGGECVVQLRPRNSEMLESFQRVARRNIRDAQKAGCWVRQVSDFAGLRELWPLFTSRAREKGIHVGQLETYEAMFRLSQRADLIRIYTGYYDQQPIFPVMILREHLEAYALISALDRSTLGDRQSPCCLVHWTAMCDYRNLGCVRYNIGGPAGTVYTFKQKFRPSTTPSPFTATWVLRPTVYWLWMRFLIPAARAALNTAKLNFR